MSPLLRRQGYQQESADRTDIFSTSTLFKGAGPGRYRMIIVCAAAADATFTINDGVSEILTAEPIPVKAAAVTFPLINVIEDVSWEWDSIAPERPLVDVIDGTSGEIAVYIEKIG